MIKLKEIIEQHVNKMPTHLQSQVLNFVLFLESQFEYSSSNDKATRKQKLKKAFEKIVAKKIFEEIDDPVVWQREQRRDRDLPFGNDTSQKKYSSQKD